MIELLQITNDPVFARRCDMLDGVRVFVDLETLGKAERQAGRDTFISVHQLDDVARVRDVLRRARLMVRVNPWHEGSEAEVDGVLKRGAEELMLPMFRTIGELDSICRLVAGRVPVIALLETREALECIDDWVETNGLSEVYVGLNDLHISLGCRFMFDPLADGRLDSVARTALQRGRRFGFGGIARMDEGLLPGRDVLAEHLRLGSGAVILSRTFHRGDNEQSFEHEVDRLRTVERALADRDPSQIRVDQIRIASRIRQISSQLGSGP